jgi:hypothetical protein
MSDFQSKDFEQQNNLKKAGAFHSKNFSKFLRSDVFQFLYRDLGVQFRLSFKLQNWTLFYGFKLEKWTPNFSMK